MRRSLVVLLAGVTAIALVTTTVYIALRQYRPQLRTGESYGVDVSNHQGAIDWRAVASDDIEFAYLKATEGSDFVDSTFEHNWAASGEAGLQRGAYHFFTFCSSANDQAAHFLRTVPRDASSLPPALDLELAGNCATRPSQQDVQREVQAFVDTVENATDKKMLLYVGDDFEGKYRISTWLERDVWQPRFMRRPSGDWVIWQFTGFAQFEGIKGRADVNIKRLDR